ncbi:SsrA-binding protein SmpB [Anderseniella sp. Alg231-50]|uniref:SsrA-binding protein SmpB n=1 Tax=Anderseniella sp. Alg231-50 TaxID=1922226 RepID=UPI000D5528B1
MSSKSGGAKRRSGNPVIADNRRARFDFEIMDNLEVGVMLTGTEVKSLRASKATIAESYVQVKNGELWWVNAHIPEYNQGNRFNHEPRRIRKLLAHAREIARLGQAVDREGLTIVPLKIYFNERGRVKLEIALAKGKKVHDKRQAEKKRDWQRDKARLMRERG